MDKNELAIKELELKTKELELMIKDLEFKPKPDAQKPKDDQRANWNNPIILAIVAGTIGYIGTLISGYKDRHIENLRQEATIKLERQKQESILFLEAIKTG